MIKVKLKTKINFDGQLKNVGDELTMTKTRFEQMQTNFKNQKLDFNKFIEILEIEATKPKGRSKKK